MPVSVFRASIAALLTSCLVAKSELPDPYPNSSAAILFHADHGFTLVEREKLYRACEQWRLLTSGRVVCDFQFDLVYPVALQYDDPVVGRGAIDDQFTIDQLSGNNPSIVSGYTHGRSFFIVYDNQSDGSILQHVAQHEIGHTLGFRHVSGEPHANIMYAYADAKVDWGPNDYTECMFLGYCLPDH